MNFYVPNIYLNFEVDDKVRFPKHFRIKHSHFSFHVKQTNYDVQLHNEK
jgi:hypothetical protein